MHHGNVYCQATVWACSEEEICGAEAIQYCDLAICGDVGGACEMRYEVRQALMPFPVSALGAAYGVIAEYVCRAPTFLAGASILGLIEGDAEVPPDENAELGGKEP